MWKLVIEDDEGKRTVVPLSRDDYTIGRQEGNTIRLTERNVSRSHGRVRRVRTASGSADAAGGSEFVLEDLRSYNGVFVNGIRVGTSQNLQHGDLIQIGDYRLVLQDDAQVSLEAATIPMQQVDPTDTKATIPIAPSYRGQTLAERPNRMVMLVGPTPGVEYPLDRDRMTVGRAEEMSISVNHNSVSRLHCEIHALGDGRFEIVDKGSSNGVRVNAVELRRSIIEAGDVIELGDVRFKFVGAGQIFVPGPNESQQLTAISDRDAELAPQRRSLSGYLLPVLGAGVVGALIILAVAYVLRSRASAEQGDAGISSDDQTLLATWKSKCMTTDCEEAHAALGSLDGLHEQPDFRFITATWADNLLAKAKADPAARRVLVDRVKSDPRVDDERKRQADALLAMADPTPTPSDLPAATAIADAGLALAALPPQPSVRTTPTSHTTVTNATTTPAAPPTPKSTSAGQSAFDKARAAVGAGADPGTVREILGKRVLNGKGSSDEALLYYGACKAQRDADCKQKLREAYPNVTF